jgi:4-amino-4-deoxychorismate lyase
MPATNTSLKVLNDAELLAQLRKLREKQPVKYTAFYSSQLGGIVTDPALMVIPFDDHMVHRGHGIFDTAGIINGKIYDLDSHLDRFLKSAERSKLRLPASRAEMRDIIIKTTATSGRRDGSIRYWLSSGTGSLDLTPVAGADPGFFVMIFAGLVYPEKWKTDGVRVMTTTYPIKPPLYAITKTTNYLPNVLMQMEAKEKGFDNGVFIDHDGHVGESSNMNVAFVSQDNVLVHPKFDHILSGCTSMRLIELAQKLVKSGQLKDVKVAHITMPATLTELPIKSISFAASASAIVTWPTRTSFS